MKLHGHSFIEEELKRAGIGFRKHDNAFLAVADVGALQAAADRLSPEIIRSRPIEPNVRCRLSSRECWGDERTPLCWTPNAKP